MGLAWSLVCGKPKKKSQRHQQSRSRQDIIKQVATEATQNTRSHQDIINQLKAVDARKKLKSRRVEEAEIEEDISSLPRRFIVIDGSNVAYKHGRNKVFSVEGLSLAIEFFAAKGFEVQAIVPEFRKYARRSSNPALLKNLEKEGKVLTTPCKNLEGHLATSYDDRFILGIAERRDGVVISNDQYRDLLNETPAWEKIIKERVVGFTWHGDELILPKDPYGKNGPTLNSILYKKS